MKPAEVSTPSDREVLVKRSFDAPVNLVWQAYTEPALMRRWLLGAAGAVGCRFAGWRIFRSGWHVSPLAKSTKMARSLGSAVEMLEVALHSKIAYANLDPGDLGESMQR